METQQWKLALLAKERILLDNLSNDPPSTVTYPPEPTYEEPVENHTQATERDRKVRNQQLKVNWQNRCKKVEEIGILCGDEPWGICEQKTISLLYLSIGTEGRRILKSKHPPPPPPNRETTFQRIVEGNGGFFHEIS